jgi:hypothetical protein
MGNKEVLLVQLDGTIPNLALMKLATHHKNLGDNVSVVKNPKDVGGSYLIQPDLVYISCIFDKNADFARRYTKKFTTAEVHLGGSGVDLKTTLPDAIEHLMPDYDLFECNESYGFTTRGCIRSCDFCIVNEKEGRIRAVADIYEFWNPKHKHIVLLDNNPMALPTHFEKIAGQIQKENLSVNFHGLDIRIINDENAEILSRLHAYPTRHFAWDSIKDEQAVLDGIEILKAHGMKQSMFYVLSGFNSTFEEDLYRLNRLKELGQRAYLMRYETVRGISEYNDLAAWANQPMFFVKVPFEEFRVMRANQRNHKFQ